MGNGITLRYRDYTIDLDRLGIMAQKAEKMLLKMINELLSNVQLLPKKSESSKYREKRFGYPDPYPVPVWNQFLDIRIRFQIHYPAGYPTGKPDSDHLCYTVVFKMLTSTMKQKQLATKSGHGSEVCCTGTGFRTQVRQDSAHFEQNESDADSGFIQVSGSRSGFSNFIVLGFDANTIVKRVFAKI